MQNGESNTIMSNRFNSDLAAITGNAHLNKNFSAGLAPV